MSWGDDNNAAIRRVVSLQPSATSTLAALGLLDTVVACTKYCVDVCPEVRGRTLIADSWSAQAEQIVAAAPDLVIASVPYQLEAVAEILKAGIRFLGLAPRTLADIFTDISSIAGVMGVPERGFQVVSDMQREFESIRTQAGSAGSRPRVFAEEWGKPIIASQQWVAEIVEMAGGKFIGDPGGKCTPEQVTSANPDVFLAAWCGAGDRVPLEKIVAARDWFGLEAVRRGRVYCISDELLNTPGPSLVRGAYAVAHALHPELFPSTPGVRKMQTHVF